MLLIGHGSFDGRIGAFNLPGPDLAVADYAKLLDGLAAQRIVFVNTASSSGAFVQVLAGPGAHHRHGDEDRRRTQRDAVPRVFRRSATGMRSPIATVTAGCRRSKRSITRARR